MKLFDMKSVKARMGTTKTQPDFTKFTGVKPERFTKEFLELKRIEKELREEALANFCK